MNPIQIFDMNLTLLGEIASPVSLRIKRKFAAVGDFEMTISASHPMAGRIAPDTILCPAGDYHKAMLVESISDAQGKELLTVSGYTLSGLLKRRVCVPPADSGATYGYDRMIGDGESLMRHYVEANVTAPESSARKMDEVALEEENQHRGRQNVPWSARFEKLDELLGDIGEYCDAGFDICPDFAAKNLRFRFLPGRDMTGTDGTRRVVFAADAGNVTATTETVDNKSAANAAIAGGAGEDEKRLILSVSPGGETGTARREIFVDAGSISEAQELTQEAERKLTSSLGKHTITATVRDTLSCRYGDTWDLGDLVFVRSRRSQMTARITQVQETHSAGKAVTLAVTFGDPVSGIEDVIRRRTRQAVR